MPDSENPRAARPSAYAQALALGFISGMRTMLGPALVSEIATPNVRLAFRLLSAGELIADKLPKTPSRLDPGPLVGRFLSGAAVGYVACRHARRPVWFGVLLGGGAAMAGAFGGYHARKALSEKLHVPDPVIAVAEDALAVGLGRRFGP